jgi:radical SAM superfamily enzyme YgiQ (UPF0313 family)
MSNRDKLKIAFVQLNAEANLGLMYLSAATKDLAETTAFVGKFEDDLISEVVRYRPDIVGFSVCSGQADSTIELNQAIKKKINCYSLFGGPHPTYFNDIIKEEGVDAVCIGEGETAYRSFLESFGRGSTNWHTPNFILKDNSSIVANDIGHFADISGLPFADREIYQRYFKNDNFKTNVVRRVISSRGCPYNCSYCFNHLLKDLYNNKGSYIRFRPVDNVIEELVYLKERYQPNSFDFVDDLFAFKPAWLEEFKDKYTKRVQLPYSCLTRIEIINERYVKSLKESNCAYLSIGIESSNEKYRKSVLKRNYTNQQIIEKINIIKKHDIKFSSLNMMFLPNESYGDALQGIKFNTKIKPFDAWVAIYQPYPKTELAAYSVENGCYDPERKKVSDDLFSDSPLEFNDYCKRKKVFYLFSFAVKFPKTGSILIFLIDYLPVSLCVNIFKTYKGYLREFTLLSLDKLNKKADLKMQGFLIRYIKSHVFKSQKDNVPF